MSTSFTARAKVIYVSPLHEEDWLTILNTIAENDFTSDPPISICKYVVYKQTMKVGVVESA